MILHSLMIFDNNQQLLLGTWTKSTVQLLQLGEPKPKHYAGVVVKLSQVSGIIIINIIIIIIIIIVIRHDTPRNCVNVAVAHRGYQI